MFRWKSSVFVEAWLRWSKWSSRILETVHWPKWIEHSSQLRYFCIADKSLRTFARHFSFFDGIWSSLFEGRKQFIQCTDRHYWVFVYRSPGSGHCSRDNSRKTERTWQDACGWGLVNTKFGGGVGVGVGGWLMGGISAIKFVYNISAKAGNVLQRKDLGSCPLYTCTGGFRLYSHFWTLFQLRQDSWDFLCARIHRTVLRVDSWALRLVLGSSNPSDHIQNIPTTAFLYLQKLLKSPRV